MLLHPLDLLGADDVAVRLCKPADGSLIRKLGDHGPDFVSQATSGLLAFSPDGRFLASVAARGNERSLRLWEVASGEELWDFRKPVAPKTSWRISTVGFSADSRMVATFGPDMRVWIWERVTGKVHVLFRPGSLFIEGVESPHSLMAVSKGVYGEAHGEWSPQDALGFSKIVSLTGMFHARAGGK